MAIAPPRRISKTRKRKRRTHYKIAAPGMMLCPNCGEMKLSHAVCKACGFYDGRQVMKVKEKATEEDAEEKTPKKGKKAEEKVTSKKPVKKPLRSKGASKVSEAPKVAKTAPKRPEKGE